MEFTEKKLRTRINQCRICLKSSKTRIILTEELKKIFLDVTQTELRENDHLSEFLCLKCATALKNAHLYRQKLIETQEELLNEITDQYLELEDQSRIGVKESDQNSSDYESSAESTSSEEEVKIFKCEFKGCDEEIEGKRQFKIHKKLHKAANKKKRSYKKPKAMCSICGVIRCDISSLQGHIDAVHKKLKKYICDHCGHVAPTRTAIAMHIKSHYKDKSEKVKFSCEKCNFETFYKHRLIRHENFDHLGMAFTCHCGKLFKDKYALQLHNNIVHLKIKNHTCEICGKEFYGKSELSNHITLKHVENKIGKFSCDECEKQFYTRKQYYGHIKYHKNTKFCCIEPGCYKLFITQKQLVQHVKIHKEERDLKCHLCDKAYFYMKDLQRHLDVVHKQTTYYCPLCSVTNNRKDYLGNHIKSAHPHISQEERRKMLKTVKFTKYSV